MFVSVKRQPDLLHAQTHDGIVPPLTWPSKYTDTPLQQPMADLDTAMEQLVQTLIKDSADLNDEGYLKATKERSKQYVRGPFNITRKAIVAEKNTWKNRMVETRSVDGDKSMFPELRANLMARPPMERITVLLQTENYPMMAAAMEAGQDMLEVDASIWPRFEQHYAIVRHLYGPSASHQPASMTMDNLTPSEPDWSAIRKDAAAKYAALMAIGDVIEAADRYLATIIPFIAGSTANLSNREVYDLLVAA